MWNLLLEGSAGAGTGTGGTSSAPKDNTVMIIILAVVAVLFIAFMVWSHFNNKKKAQKAQEKLDGLKVGDEAKTIGGICGKIAEINKEENTFVLETGLGNNKTYIKFLMGALYMYGDDGKSAPQKAEVKEEKPAEAPAEATEEKKTEEKKED